MQKRAKTSGITLIALVITIIVLLILAGVAIATLTGDNGILTKAVQAKDATRGGEVKDYVRMAVAENVMAERTNGTKRTRAEVISELSTQGKLTAEEVAKLTDEENPVDIITIGGIDINFGELGSASGKLTLAEMYDKAVADGCTNENGNCTDPEHHLHIGDYVDYKNPTSGSKRANATDTGYDTDQIYEASKNQLNWRILGKDSATGGIKLIAGRPMKSNNAEDDPYLHLYGAKGYINSEIVLNDLCSMYTTEYGTARSVNQKDVDEITGVTTDEKIKEVDLTGSYKETYSFENQYTPQSWLNGKQTTTVSGIANAYAYIVQLGNGTNVSKTFDAKEIAKLATTKSEIKLASSSGPSGTSAWVQNERAYNMLFNNISVPKEAQYWLASRGVGAYSGVAYFGPGMVVAEDGVTGAGTDYLFGSCGYEYGAWAGVRPVVSLKSNITENEVPKIADKTEETWDFSGGSGNQPS